MWSALTSPPALRSLPAQSVEKSLGSELKSPAVVSPRACAFGARAAGRLHAERCDFERGTLL